MKSTKALTALLLAALLGAGTLASCGGQGGAGDATSAGETSPAESTTATTVVTEPPETKRADAKDTLPAGLDFKGAVFTTVCRVNGTYYIEFVGEQTGDIIDDAVYERNSAVEERLKVKLERKEFQGANDEIPKFVKTSVLAGDDFANLVASHANATSTYILQGLYHNVLDLPHVDLEMPWWNQSMIEEITMFDKLYCLNGDIAVSSTLGAYVTYFNKRLVGEYVKDDLYKLVWDGGWTIDKFGEIVKTIYKDTNGDGKRDEKDFYGYGLAFGTSPCDAFTTGFGCKIIEKDKDGTPKLVFNSENTADMFQKMYNFCYENSGVYYIPGTATTDGLAKMWTKYQNGESVFYINQLGGTFDLREMVDDYGVLPIPKGTDEQESYQTVSHNGFSLMTVPATNKNLEMTGAVLEALCAETYRSVTETVFEVALKVKYLRGEDDSEMYDLIIGSQTFDLGNIWAAALKNISWMARQQIGAGNGNFASAYAANAAAYQTSLDTLIETYKNL